jgi:GNAT superfamily N-acetyltransferase
MKYSLKTVHRLADIPDHADFEALRREWFTLATAELASIGGPIRTADEMMVDFWPDMQNYLAPHGCTILALDDAGGLVGTGSLRKLRPDAADLKRMYVRPSARGAKLGLALVERRIEEARKMGLTTLFTNTIYINHRMLEIYEGLGFERISRFPECHEPIEMDHLLIYLKMGL